MSLNNLNITVQALLTWKALKEGEDEEKEVKVREEEREEEAEEEGEKKPFNVLHQISLSCNKDYIFLGDEAFTAVYIKNR